MDFPRKFGKYTLLKHLATGGMAEIFLARQEGMGGFAKDVVLKRLLPTHAENQELVGMFLDEARIAANLTHPNIAQIYDLGQEDDAYFIAMEYVRGADLRRVCSQGIAEDDFLPLNHAVRVAAEVCDALAYAHEKTDAAGEPMGIVHRDVSPTNILITYEGGVKLVDFGIAKAENKATVTKAGQVKGKFGYMAPEQALGREVDHRTDIFAVGINLYEITVGRRLFRATTDLEALEAIEKCDFPRPREVSPGYPEALERIVMRALSSDADDRFASARELQMALEAFAAEAGLRSTAGMLSEYMRRLFREQLALEAKEGVTLHAVTEEAHSEPPEEPEAPEPEEKKMADSDQEPTEQPDEEAQAPAPEAQAAAPAPPRSEPPPSPEPPAESLSAEASAAGWNALNVVPSTPKPATADKAPTPKQAAQFAAIPPPEPLTDDDLKIRKPRSYTGLLLLVLIAVGGWAVYTAMTQTAAHDDARRKPIEGFIAPKLQELGKAPELPEAKPVKKSLMRITTVPPGARVAVNGNVLGSVTPTAVQVPEGSEATVRAMLAGHLPSAKRLKVTPGEMDVALKLEAGEPKKAKLNIESAPVGALVEIDGNLVGETPMKLETIPSGGEITVRFTKEGYYPHTVVYGVPPGYDGALPVKLVPESGPRTLGLLRIESIPGYAMITRLDGEKPEPLGRVRQPIDLNTVRVGDTIELRAAKKGLETVETTIEMRDPYHTVYMRLPEPERFNGKLSVLGPKGVTVYLKGENSGAKELGETPIRNHELPEGPYELTLMATESRKRMVVKVEIERVQVDTFCLHCS